MSRRNDVCASKSSEQSIEAGPITGPRTGSQQSEEPHGRLRTGSIAGLRALAAGLVLVLLSLAAAPA
ncbi:MAG: hypothetical protein ACE5F5_13225, partial [Acidimicrobiia bacterium]